MTARVGIVHVHSSYSHDGHDSVEDLRSFAERQGIGFIGLTDHAEDLEILELQEVHVHGLPLNKDQQLGPVPKLTPWPKIPPQLDGKEIDDWMKARFLVSKNATATVVVLEPCKHRELTQAGLQALNKWTFDPQMKGDEPVDGEITVRIHFRTQ